MFFFFNYYYFFFHVHVHVTCIKRILSYRDNYVYIYRVEFLIVFFFSINNELRNLN